MRSDNLEPATIGDLLRKRDGARCDHGLPLSGPCSLCADPLTVQDEDYRTFSVPETPDAQWQPAFDPRVRASWLVPLALACVVLGIVVGRVLS